jgi:hypothetical protein
MPVTVKRRPMNTGSKIIEDPCSGAVANLFRAPNRCPQCGQHSTSAGGILLGPQPSREFDCAI